MRFIRKIRYGQDIDLVKHPGHVFWYGLLLLCILAAPVFLMLLVSTYEVAP